MFFDSRCVCVARDSNLNLQGGPKTGLFLIQNNFATTNDRKASKASVQLNILCRICTNRQYPKNSKTCVRDRPCFTVFRM